MCLCSLLFVWLYFDVFVQCSVCLTVFWCVCVQCSVCLTVFWCVCTVLKLLSDHRVPPGILQVWLFWQGEYNYKHVSFGKVSTASKFCSFDKASTSSSMAFGKVNTSSSMAFGGVYIFKFGKVSMSSSLSTSWFFKFGSFSEVSTSSSWAFLASEYIFELDSWKGEYIFKPGSLSKVNISSDFALLVSKPSNVWWGHLQVWHLARWVQVWLLCPVTASSSSFTWWFVQLQFYLVVCTAPVLPGGLYSSSFI